MNIYLEIFGYCGTALVLLSMMMTSVVKLRWFNSAGSLISMVYAYFNNTWPVVLLNFGLLLINIVQLVRLYRVKVNFDFAAIGADDGSLDHFLKFYDKDIKQFFPDFQKETAGQTVYMVYRNADPVGVLMGEQNGDELTVTLDYTTPQYRDCSVATYLFGRLKEFGINSLTAHSNTKAHIAYLQKMGFEEKEDQRVKQL